MAKGHHVKNEWHELDPYQPHEYSSSGPETRRKVSLNVEEATDIFGDAQTAEDYGYVNRGLKSRHIQFLALGGTIGTGLFLGIGRAFTQAGPLSLLLGYTITGVAIYAMMMSLGEMATWLPLPGAIPQFAARYVDPAMGFAVGWNTWYQCAITLCAEISAAAVVIQFWEGARDINIAAWISIIMILIIGLNIFMVSVYGEAEFWFASIKLITIVGLLIFAFVIDLGGGPKRDRLGFRYWHDPGAMKEFVAKGDTGRFLGLWSVITNSAFSYAGVEMVAVAAGEADRPRVTIPKACRRVLWRVLLFYVLGSLAIGVLVPYNDQMLLDAQKLGKDNTAASPWVIAAYRAAVPVLPSIINAVILTSATSSANAYLYTGARILYGLAQNGQAPRQLLYCSRRGIPYYCIMVTASIALLTFMSCSKGSSTVFVWFQNLVVIANLFTWMSVSIAYIRFHAALKAQGVDRNLFGTAPSTDSNSGHRSPSPPATTHYYNGKPIYHPSGSSSSSSTSPPPFKKDPRYPFAIPPLKPPPHSHPHTTSNPPRRKSSSWRAFLNGTPQIIAPSRTSPPNSHTRNHRDDTNPTASTSTVKPSHTNAGGESHYHMPFRAPLQPYLAYFSLIYFALIVLFNGFYVFPSTASHRSASTSTLGPGQSPPPKPKGFDLTDFITSYAGIPIYFGLYLFWKLFKRTKVVDPARADIWTGKRALDEAVWEEGEGGCWGRRKRRKEGKGVEMEGVGGGRKGEVDVWTRIWRWVV